MGWGDCRGVDCMIFYNMMEVNKSLHNSHYVTLGLRTPQALFFGSFFNLNRNFKRSFLWLIVVALALVVVLVVVAVSMFSLGVSVLAFEANKNWRM